MEHHRIFSINPKVNLRMDTQIHTPHRGTRGRGVDGTPPQSFWYVAVFRNDFALSGKPLIFSTKVFFIYPFLRRLKLGKSLQRRCVNFSTLKLTFLSEKNPYSGKHLFAKQESITRARLRGQEFATGKNFSFNQCHTKSFAFFLGKVIL